MKNEIKKTTSKTKEKISTRLDQQQNDQFYLNDKKRSDEDNQLIDKRIDRKKRTKNPSLINTGDDLNSRVNRLLKTNQSNLLVSNLIPPLTRIGSDKSTNSLDSFDKKSSSTFSLTKPVGNLTPIKYEYLQSTNKQINQFDQFNNLEHHQINKRKSKQSIKSPQQDQFKHTFIANRSIDLNRNASNSLNSIHSTNLSDESSSNRSSPDLPINQRTYSPIEFDSTKIASNNFKPAYSSSNLFDSIQHLDVHKLIQKKANDRKLFWSTSTLHTLNTNQSNVFVPKNAKYVDVYIF